MSLSDSRLSIVHCSKSENNNDGLMGNSSSSSPNRSTMTHMSGGHNIGSMGPLKAPTPRRPPMPHENEVERRFNEVLIKMDLPPEKAKHLRTFDISKKWDIICDQVRFMYSAKGGGGKKFFAPPQSLYSSCTQ